MTPHLPRPARAHVAAVTRALRRLRKHAAADEGQKAKLPKRPSRAFSALRIPTPPSVAANATSSSD